MNLGKSSEEDMGNLPDFTSATSETFMIVWVAEWS